MRVLGIGDYHSLGDLYARLQALGHEVRVYVAKPEAHGIFSGMVSRVARWEDQLDWVRQAGDDGLIVFETANQGELQQALRRDGFRVFGGCAWGDRIENDRAFGQRVMRDAGLRTARSYEFTDFDAALSFLTQHPARYVYKPSSSEAESTQTYIAELSDGSDLRAMLISKKARSEAGASSRFVLMEYMEGVEVGVGGFFNGREFLKPTVLDFEHKRFFNGDLGELTGEMGTVVTYRGGERLFEATLGKISAALRDHGYCGYINLNMIANEQGLWPLEFTCRFGYPGFAICSVLHEQGWDEILKSVVSRQSSTFKTRPGFGVGVVLTVPPFPYEKGYDALSKGAPIFFREALTSTEREHLHFGEVARGENGYTTSGSIGYVMVVTGAANDLAKASDAAYQLARKVVVRNLRYRTDIGRRLMERDGRTLAALGYADLDLSGNSCGMS